MEIEYLFEENLDTKLNNKIQKLLKKDELHANQVNVLTLEVSRLKREKVINIEAVYDEFEALIDRLEQQYYRIKKGKIELQDGLLQTVVQMREFREFKLKYMRAVRKQKK